MINKVLDTDELKQAYEEGSLDAEALGYKRNPYGRVKEFAKYRAYNTGFDNWVHNFKDPA